MRVHNFSIHYHIDAISRDGIKSKIFGRELMTAANEADARILFIDMMAQRGRDVSKIAVDFIEQLNDIAMMILQ